MLFSRKEKNKKTVANRHEVYSAENADYFDSIIYIDTDLEKVSGNALSDIDERVRKTLSKMKPKQAALLIKVFVEKVPQKQIAALEGVAPAAICQRLRVAKNNFITIYNSQRKGK